MSYAGDPLVYGTDFIGPLLPGSVQGDQSSGYVVVEPTYLPGGSGYYGNPYTNPAAAINALVGQGATLTSPWTLTPATGAVQPSSSSGLLVLAAVGLGLLLVMRRR